MKNWEIGTIHPLRLREFHPSQCPPPGRTRRVCQVRSGRRAGSGALATGCFALRSAVPQRGPAAARQGGLLVNAVRPDAIRLAPPLILTEADVDEALPILVDALANA